MEYSEENKTTESYRGFCDINKYELAFILMKIEIHFSLDRKQNYIFKVFLPIVRNWCCVDSKTNHINH